MIEKLERYVSLGIITRDQADTIRKMEDNTSGGGGRLERLEPQAVGASNDVTIRLPGGIHLIIRDAGEAGA